MNIFKGLLFLQGHFFAGDDHDAAEPSPATAAAASAKRRSTRFGLLDTLSLLGGRPMHPDQPYDREEPLEQLVDACCTH